MIHLATMFPPATPLQAPLISLFCSALICFRSDPHQNELHNSREFCLLGSHLAARSGMGTYRMPANMYWMDPCANEWISAVCCDGDWPQPFERGPTATDCRPVPFMVTAAVVAACWACMTNTMSCVKLAGWVGLYNHLSNCVRRHMLKVTQLVGHGVN